MSQFSICIDYCIDTAAKFFDKVKPNKRTCAKFSIKTSYFLYHIGLHNNSQVWLKNKYQFPTNTNWIWTVLDNNLQYIIQLLFCVRRFALMMPSISIIIASSFA